MVGLRGLLTPAREARPASSRMARRPHAGGRSSQNGVRTPVESAGPETRRKPPFNVRKMK